MNAQILRIPNPEHERRVLDTRRALRLVPPSEGVRHCDSGRLPKGEDAQRLSGEAKPERPNEDSASPNLRENHHD